MRTNPLLKQRVFYFGRQINSTIAILKRHGSNLAMHLSFQKDGDLLVIVDRDAVYQLRLTKGAARAVCRFLMKELNVISAVMSENGKTYDLFQIDKELREYRENGQI